MLFYWVYFFLLFFSFFNQLHLLRSSQKRTTEAWFRNFSSRTFSVALMEVIVGFFSPPDRLMVTALRDDALNAIISSPMPRWKALKDFEWCAFFSQKVTENPPFLQENVESVLLKNQSHTGTHEPILCLYISVISQFLLQCWIFKKKVHAAQLKSFRVFQSWKKKVKLLSYLDGRGRVTLSYANQSNISQSEAYVSSWIEMRKDAVFSCVTENMSMC